MIAVLDLFSLIFLYPCKQKYDLIKISLCWNKKFEYPLTLLVKSRKIYFNVFKINNFIFKFSTENYNVSLKHI